MTLLKTDWSSSTLLPTTLYFPGIRLVKEDLVLKRFGRFREKRINTHCFLLKGCLYQSNSFYFFSTMLKLFDAGNQIMFKMPLMLWNGGNFYLERSFFKNSTKYQLHSIAITYPIASHIHFWGSHSKFLSSLPAHRIREVIAIEWSWYFVLFSKKLHSSICLFYKAWHEK